MSIDYAQIVEGCRRRDPKFQRALYDATCRMALGVCRRYSRDRDEAQDQMQDAYIKVYEKIGSLREPDKLMSWVYNIMVNTCLDRHRNEHEVLPIDQTQLQAVTLDLDPYAVEEIIAALQKLPPLQRKVFNLCEVEGYSLDEVAARLDSNNLAVRVNLCRAKERLRKLLTS